MIRPPSKESAAIKLIEQGGIVYTRSGKMIVDIRYDVFDKDLTEQTIELIRDKYPQKCVVKVDFIENLRPS